MSARRRTSPRGWIIAIGIAVGSSYAVTRDPLTAAVVLVVGSLVALIASQVTADPVDRRQPGWTRGSHLRRPRRRPSPKDCILAIGIAVGASYVATHDPLTTLSVLVVCSLVAVIAS